MSRSSIISATNSSHSIELEIPKAHLRKTSGQSEIVFYEVRCKIHLSSSKQISDVLFKRFSDFDRLDQKLRKNFPALSLPELPKKKVFGNLNSNFVEKRRKELEYYLYHLITHENTTIRNSADLLAFLPASFARESRTEGIYFEITEVAMLKNKQILLSVHPTEELLRFADTTSSSGLDNEESKQEISLSELVSVSEMDASHTKINFSYIETESNTSTASNNYATLASNQQKDLNNSLHSASVLNSASFSSSMLKSRKKVFEFASSDDRYRFLRVIRAMESVGARAKTPTNLSEIHCSKPEFTTLSVFCSTFNMAQGTVPENVADWLPEDAQHSIIVIGVQECQSAINVLADSLAKPLRNKYICVAKKNLWAIAIVVFVRAELFSSGSIYGIESASLATGIMGILGNKGGVAVALKIHNLSVCFVNSHLAAHDHCYADRNRMFEEIDGQLRVGNSSLDLSLQFDVIYWLGDLNYRVELPVRKVVECINYNDLDPMRTKDQLRRAQFSQEAFAGYSEGKINFLPTYKFLMLKKNKSPNNTAPGKPRSENQTDGSNEGGKLSAAENNTTAAVNSSSKTQLLSSGQAQNKAAESKEELSSTETLGRDDSDEEYEEESITRGYDSDENEENLVNLPENSTISAVPGGNNAVLHRVSISSDDSTPLPSKEPSSPANSALLGKQTALPLHKQLQIHPTRPGAANLAALANLPRDSLIITAKNSKNFFSPANNTNNLSSTENIIVTEVDQDFDLMISRNRSRAHTAEPSSLLGKGKKSSIIASSAGVPLDKPPLLPSSASFDPNNIQQNSVHHSSPDAASPANTDSNDGVQEKFSHSVLSTALQQQLRLEANSDLSSTTDVTENSSLLADSRGYSVSISVESEAASASYSRHQPVTSLEPRSDRFESSSAPTQPGNFLPTDHSDLEFYSQNRKETHNGVMTTTAPSATLEPAGGVTAVSKVKPIIPGKRLFNRHYSKKRIPSWCDRILWRSIHDSMVQLKSYTRCEAMDSSDHLPVTAQFDMKVPLHPPITAYSFAASIYLSNLTLDITHFIKASSPYPPLLEEKIYLEFFGSFLSENSRGKRTGYGILKNRSTTAEEQAASQLIGQDLGNLNISRPKMIFANWAEQDIPVLQTTLGLRQFIANEKLFFSIKSGQQMQGAGQIDLVLGQGVIRLSKLSQQPASTARAVATHNESLVRAPPLSSMLKPDIDLNFDSNTATTAWQFCSLVERHSKSLGTLQGNIMVDLAEDKITPANNNSSNLSNNPQVTLL
jgi:hypothetical protein